MNKFIVATSAIGVNIIPMEGSFVLKEQIGKIGFYAKVRLEVHKISGRQLEIDPGKFTQWSTAISFAANYFFNRYSQGGLKITILDIHDNDVDTNHIVIFFVVVHALHQALNMQCNLTINDSGNFIIPK